MDGLCILQLARDKFGWVGLANPKPEFRENLFGWGEQACVPDIDWKDVLGTKMQVPCTSPACTDRFRSRGSDVELPKLPKGADIRVRLRVGFKNLVPVRGFEPRSRG